MNQIKQWLADHHSAVLATLVAAQNLPYLKGTAKYVLLVISNIFSAMT